MSGYPFPHPRILSMNKLLLCILTTLAFAGCDKPEAEDPTPAPTATARPKTPVAAVTPQPNDWMWKNAKGTPRNSDPLSISDDPFAHKTKK